MQAYPVVVRASAAAAIATAPPVAAALVQRLRLASTESTWHNLSCSVLDNIHCLTIYIPAYFLGVGLLQGDTLARAQRNLADEWWTSYVACSGFWIPYMWLNFSLVPAVKRVQFMAAGNLVWSVAIDWIAHRGVHTDNEYDTEHNVCGMEEQGE